MLKNEASPGSILPPFSEMDVERMGGLPILDTGAGGMTVGPSLREVDVPPALRSSRRRLERRYARAPSIVIPTMVSGTPMATPLACAEEWVDKAPDSRFVEIGVGMEFEFEFELSTVLETFAVAVRIQRS